MMFSRKPLGGLSGHSGVAGVPSPYQSSPPMAFTIRMGPTTLGVTEHSRNYVVGFTSPLTARKIMYGLSTSLQDLVKLHRG